jgi:hypothetical protein
VSLVLSALSAIPLVWGVDFVVDILEEIEFHSQVFSLMKQVQNVLIFNAEHFPFMAYVTIGWPLRIFCLLCCLLVLLFC